MMKIVVTVLITLGPCSQHILAQIDTTRRDFFPLHVGDLWQYSDEFGNLSTLQVAVADTLLDNGQHYAAIGVPPHFSTGYGYYRIDTLLRVQSHRGFGGDSCGGTAQDEVSTYRLGDRDSAVWHDCLNFGGYLTPNALIRFDGVRSRFVFGEWRETMIFEFGGVFPAPVDTFFGSYGYLVRGIGIFMEEYYEWQGYRLLTGAIVNGVLYGTVDVRNFPSYAPQQVELRQNYPNPFNSSTTIQFSINRELFISLRVYNLLGQEVATLVEGNVNAGQHSIRWSAKGIPSGMYVCRLTAGEKTTTTKLLLLQ